MTTDAAFTQLISDKEKCLEIGMSAENYKKIRQRFNNGTLTQKPKTFWLEKAGYTYKLTWHKPK